MSKVRRNSYNSAGSQKKAAYTHLALVSNTTSPTYAKPIGLRIKELRLEQGLQQKDLTAGEFSQAYISLVEAGRTMPSLRALELIAANLGVSLFFLLGEEISTKSTSATITRSEVPPSETEQTSKTEWETLLAEVQLNMKHEPRLGRNLLLSMAKMRQLSTSQLKQYYQLLAECNYTLGDLDSALADFTKDLDLAVRTNDCELLARINNQLGLIHYQKGELKQALEAHQQAATSIEQAAQQGLDDPALELEVYYNLANDFYVAGDFTRAFSYYQQVKTLVERLWKNKAQLAQKLEKVGLRYREAGDLQKALEFSHRALQIYRELELERMQAQVEARYGLLLTSQMQPQIPSTEPTSR